MLPQEPAPYDLRINKDGTDKQLPAELINRASALTASGLYHVFFFDLEASEISPSTASIIQIYFHHVQSDEGLNLFVYPYRNLTTKLPQKVVEMTSITLELLKQEGALPFDAHAAQALLEWILDRIGPEGGVPLLVAHNGKKYDRPVLHRHWAACGFSIPWSWELVDTTHVYTQDISPHPANAALHDLSALPLLEAEARAFAWRPTHRWRASHRLWHLMLLYHVEVEGAQLHRADGDVKVLMAVADKMAQEGGLEVSSFMEYLDIKYEGQLAPPSRQLPPPADWLLQEVDAWFGCTVNLAGVCAR